MAVSVRSYRIEYIITKHLHFIGSPLGRKSIRAIPGIEETLGERLVDQGFIYAFQIYEKYRSLGKHKRLFEKWMKENYGATTKEADYAFFALKSWEFVHM